MSGICGWIGRAPSERLDAMLAAIDYRGDTSDRYSGDGVALGYRYWTGRPGKSPGIHRAGGTATACAGTLAPPVASPAESLARRLAMSRAQVIGASIIGALVAIAAIGAAIQGVATTYEWACRAGWTSSPCAVPVPPPRIDIPA